MEVDETVKTNSGSTETISSSWSNNRPYSSRATGNTALGFGIAGTALGLMAGGLNLFNNNKSGANSDYPTAFEVYKKCEDYRFNAQGELSAYALAQAGQRFDDAASINSRMFDLYQTSTERDFTLYKEQRDLYDVLLDKIHEVDAKVSHLGSTVPLQFALESANRSAADNAIVSYANSTFAVQNIADVTTGTTSTAKVPFNPLSGYFNN